MPRPTIGQTLHFVVIGSIIEPPGGTWAESDGLIGMIHNTKVPISSVSVPTPYGWTYNNAPSLRAGLDNTGSKTPAVTGWNAFKAARLAGPGVDPIMGFYKGIYDFKDEAAATTALRWPPANFFPSEIPNDYRIPNSGTPSTAVADYSKAGAVDFYKNLALSVINGSYGHPAEELLHFDQVGMVQASWALSWYQSLAERRRLWGRISICL